MEDRTELMAAREWLDARAAHPDLENGPEEDESVSETRKMIELLDDHDDHYCPLCSDYFWPPASAGHGAMWWYPLRGREAHASN